jgi:predicted DNA-binding transcriptional regulator AlpA
MSPDARRRSNPRVGSALVELVSRSEVARILGVTTRTVQRYTERPDFPEPIGRLATGRVWKRVDIEAWARKTLPLPQGRPRKEQ